MHMPVCYNNPKYSMQNLSVKFIYLKSSGDVSTDDLLGLPTSLPDPWCNLKKVKLIMNFKTKCMWLQKTQNTYHIAILILRERG